MKEITLIGLGRLGTHLLKAFTTKGWSLIQVFAGKTVERQELCEQLGTDLIDDWRAIKRHQGLYLLAVPDDAIKSVSALLYDQIGDTNLVAHTSGNTSLEILRHHFSRPGLFYPLQSFSIDANIEWKGLPIFIQSDNETDHEILKTLGHSLGAQVVTIKDEQRPYLHMAAVIANNFTNALLRWSKETLHQQGLSFYYLHPLIRQGIEKSLEIGPEQAQTGPAQRGDLITIKAHLELLANDPEKQALYQMLSELINPDITEDL